MTKLTACLAAILVLTIPSLASAQNAYAGLGAPSRAVHHHAGRPSGEVRLARPNLGQPPQTRNSAPAISRDPNDCVKTMCTCLGGGGC